MFTHVEAFCLMKYRCEICATVETLYNARDGVTPYIIPCSVCEGMMQHIDWTEDKRDERYIPERGQRIFISMTQELAWIFARARLEKFENTESPPPAEGTPERAELEQALMDDEFWKNGEAPCLYVF